MGEVTFGDMWGVDFGKVLRMIIKVFIRTKITGDMVCRKPGRVPRHRRSGYARILNEISLQQ